MKLSLQCVLCLLRWVYGRTAVTPVDPGESFMGMRRLLSVASGLCHENMNTALFSNRLVEGVWEMMGHVIDPFYQRLKKRNNENAASLLAAAQEFIDRGRGSGCLERACQIAVSGNVAPLGASSHGFEFTEVKEVIHGKLKPVVKGDVYEAVKTARRVLYVTDNAGEIGFDSLLISIMKEMGCHVTLLVKAPLFFEDATLGDARFFGLEKLVAAIVTVRGVFIPGRSYSALTDKAYEDADLIISKGTGNFEALKGEIDGKSVIYMLKIKCDPIADIVKIGQGPFIVDLEGSRAS